MDAKQALDELRAEFAREDAMKTQKNNKG